MGRAELHVKDSGILAGVELAEKIFYHLDPAVQIDIFIQDGSAVKKGGGALQLWRKSRAILMGERLALNCMQRMSGIATLTNQYVKRVEGYKAKILDTRK